MKLLSLFSGIGAFEKALTNLGVEYELVGFSEIDKWAIESYSAVHGVSTDLNLGDVSEVEIEDIPETDIVTYGFPCQDVSIAGKQKGISCGTRSGLLFKAERIIEGKKPKYAIAENVKNLVGKRFKQDFDDLLERLDGYGYNNYWEVLNAKDYGIPQNRERVFIVSIRKDIDDGTFEFPEPQELELTLRDMLDDEVEDKYDVTHTYVEYLQPKGNVIGEVDIKGNESIRRVYDENGIAPTLSTMQGGHREPKIKVERVKKINKVRKYPVNIEKLKETLKSAKEESGLTNKDIAKALEVNITTVEHWFRQDNSFSIPAPEIWGKLKDLLEVVSTEFDKSITTFEYKENKYDLGNRIYLETGISPTITTSGDVEIKVREATKKGYDIATENDSINISFPKSKTRRGRVGKGVAQTLDTQCNQAVLQEVKVDSKIKPSVAKNFEREKSEIAISDKEIYQCKADSGWQDNKVGLKVSPTLRANNHHTSVLDSNYVIRKLTPLECWRLMGFEDEDYWKARRRLEEVFYNGNDRSNSQMYKQAGNSIVVNVLEEIFKELFKIK